MRSKRYLIALVVALVLLSTGVAFAATQQQNNGGGGQGAYGNASGNAALCTEDPAQNGDGSQVRAGNGNYGAATENPVPVYDNVPDGDLTPALETMLVAAIQDEFKAKAEYEALIGEFGEARPFTNIVSAEQSHIDALTRIFELYGLAVPEDNGAESAVVPATLEEALQAGIDAEICNIAMYEGFLKQKLPDDVRSVFQTLMDASENHQNAFERRLDALS